MKPRHTTVATEYTFTLRPEVRDAVVAVLQRSGLGFAVEHARSSENTGLPLWKRAANRLAAWLGADTAPFTDPLNFYRCERRSLAAVADPRHVDEALRVLAPVPRCRVCGAGPEKLLPDPAGYYVHASSHSGAPLLCDNDHD